MALSGNRPLDEPAKDATEVDFSSSDEQLNYSSLFLFFPFSDSQFLFVQPKKHNISLF